MTRPVRNAECLIPAIALVSMTLLLAPASRAASKSAPADGWPEIPPAEKSLARVDADPEADVVILNNERNGKILKRADDWVNVMDYHWRAKVLTEAGRKLDDVVQVRIPGGKHSRVVNIMARTVKPDGTAIELPQNQIFEKTVTRGSVKYSEWVFSFPAVEKGSIVEYKYDRFDNYLGYIRAFDLEGPGYTMHSRVTQAMPEEAGYQILCSHCPPGTAPKVRKWVEGPARGKMYEIDLVNLPGYRDEILMPPRGEVSPRLEMVLNSWHDVYWEPLKRQDRLFVDWDSAAAYAEFYYEKAMKDGQPAFKTLVSQWFEGVTDRQEKIRSALRHVRDDFRYIPWDDVVGGSRPVGKLVEEMNADNEEKAVLLKAALEIGGIETHFGLIAGRHVGPINTDFFGLSQFTHTAVAVPKPDGTNEWLDPTVPYAPYGFVPWKDSGARALLIVKGKGQMVDLPVKNEPGRRHYDVRVEPQDNGQAKLTIEAELTGEDGIDWRGSLGPAGEEERRQSLIDWLHERLPGATIGSYEIQNIEKADEPLKIRIEATAAGLVTRADELTLVRTSLLTGFESNPIHTPDRRHPLCVDRGWNVQEETVIAPPQGMEPAPLPSPAQADSSVARISFQCSTTLEGDVRCLRVFSAGRKRWPATYMEKFSKMIDKLVQADRATIAFQKKAAG